MTHTISYCFRNFTSFHRIYGKCLLICYFFTFFFGIDYLQVIFISHISFIIPLRRFFLAPPRTVTCLLVLLFFFMSSYYLGRCSFPPWHSRSGNWNCTKGFLLIVCTLMLQNYFEMKNCIIGRQLFLKTSRKFSRKHLSWKKWLGDRFFFKDFS